MNSKSVYAIYKGCKFEGGRVVDIYENCEDAINEAEKMAKEQNALSLRVHVDEDDPSEWEWCEQEAVSPIVKHWANPVDEIYVIEYHLK